MLRLLAILALAASAFAYFPPPTNNYYDTCAWEPAQQILYRSNDLKCQCDCCPEDRLIEIKYPNDIVILIDAAACVNNKWKKLFTRLYNTIQSIKYKYVNNRNEEVLKEPCFQNRIKEGCHKKPRFTLQNDVNYNMTTDTHITVVLYSSDLKHGRNISIISGGNFNEIFKDTVNGRWNGKAPQLWHDAYLGEGSYLNKGLQGIIDDITWRDDSAVVPHLKKYLIVVTNGRSHPLVTKSELEKQAIKIRNQDIEIYFNAIYTPTDPFECQQCPTCCIDKPLITQLTHHDIIEDADLPWFYTKLRNTTKTTEIVGQADCASGKVSYEKCACECPPLTAFPGPKGCPGPRGPRPPQPPTHSPPKPAPSGTAGLPGRAGPNGKNGENGKNGKNGGNGHKGIIGVTGQQGSQGKGGEKGTSGCHGPSGPRGDTGHKGIKGNNGTIGDDGSRGCQGFTGDTGCEGDKGKDGDIGKKGDTGRKGNCGCCSASGEPGHPGPDGDKGPNGLNGPLGPPGKAGLVGAPGKQGPNGSNGKNGIKGEIGKPGDNGKEGDQGKDLGLDKVALEAMVANVLNGMNIACKRCEGEFMCSCGGNPPPPGPPIVVITPSTPTKGSKCDCDDSTPTDGTPTDGTPTYGTPTETHKPPCKLRTP